MRTGTPPDRAQAHQICQYFNIVWDEVDELQHLACLSHPRVTVDTSGLSPEATELANLLAQDIRKLPEAKVKALLGVLRET